MTKPPYRVPSMREIERIKPNDYLVASTFSGCGGSSLGYRLAGFRVAWASEFIDAAREVYEANAAPGTYLDGRDIREVKPEEILAAIGIDKGDLDLLDGSPPCASFSVSGQRDAGWGRVKKYSDKEQRTDDLFWEFVRILRGLKPKTFVAENVAGLVKGTAKGYFLEILGELKASGYRVSCRVLDAQWLGVPQARQRTIFVGVREDLGLEPAHPAPLPYRYTLRDAIGDALRLEPVEPETDISPYAIGKEWDKLAVGVKCEKYFNLFKTHPDAPVPTILASHGSPSIASVTHPTERRKFSIAELKRICGFPDDFKLSGTYAQQWERLGRAVPPVMMAAVARTVRDEILNKAGAPVL